MSTNFDKYFNLLPEHLRAKAIIAGGAAVDFEKATDVDLWVVLGRIHYEDAIYLAANTRQDVVEWLEAQGYLDVDYGLEPTETTPGSFVIHRRPVRDYMSDRNIEKMITLTFFGPNEKPVQIMFATYDTPIDVLEAFDISTHMVAIGPDGQQITCRYTTPTYMPPILVAPNDRTRSRLQKILARYGHDSTDETVDAMLAPWLAPGKPPLPPGPKSDRGGSIDDDHDEVPF